MDVTIEAKRLTTLLQESLGSGSCSVRDSGKARLRPVETLSLFGMNSGKASERPENARKASV